MNGRKAIVDFYTRMFRTVREDLVINQIVYDDNAIVGDFVSVFTAVADAPDFVVKPLKKGESVRVPVFVYYTLKGGLISEIRVARSGRLRNRNARVGAESEEALPDHPESLTRSFCFSGRFFHSSVVIGVARVRSSSNSARISPAKP